MNLQEVCIMPFTPTPALPDPFLGPDGKRITSPDAWPQQARYIRDLCEEHLYGTWPDAPKSVEERLRASTDYRGTAVRLTGHLVIDGRNALPVCYIYPSGKGPFPIITFNTTRLGMQSPLEQEIIDSGYGIFSFDRLYYGGGDERRDVTPSGTNGARPEGGVYTANAGIFSPRQKKMSENARTLMLLASFLLEKKRISMVK